MYQECITGSMETQAKPAPPVLEANTNLKGLHSIGQLYVQRYR